MEANPPKTNKEVLMNRILASFVAALLLAAVANAQTTTVSAGLFSQYVVDNGDLPYDAPVIQADVTWAFKSGTYVNLWGSAGKNGGREVDYTLGWGNKYLDLSGGYFLHAGGSPAN